MHQSKISISCSVCVWFITGWQRREDREAA